MHFPIKIVNDDKKYGATWHQSTIYSFGCNELHKLQYVMSAMFQVQLLTNTYITTPNIVL